MKNNIHKISGNSFIDENHNELLGFLDEITLFLRDEWDKDLFHSKIQNFIVSLENHYNHEEVILKGAGFENMDAHTLKHRELSMYLRIESLMPIDYDAAINFLSIIRSRIFSHELYDDQEYWPLFEPETPHTDTPMVWSSEFETGDMYTDKHHKAIINYINRLHQRLEYSSDIKLACNELTNLCAYSEHHFQEEESSLGSKLRPLHKTNHQTLINDLNALIKEVEAGKYKLNNIGDYLKFWFLNHVQTFDIPAFKNN